MSNKKILKTAIIVSITLAVMVMGMLLTNSYEFSINNFMIGAFASIFIVFVGRLIFSVADVFIEQLPDELLEDVAVIVPDVPTKTIEELEQCLEMDNLVLPMSDDEFYLFLSKGRYGQSAPEKGAILHLLEQIKGDPRYESKEKIIYKKLQEIKE